MRSPALKSSWRPEPMSPAQLREQRRLHRLEQQDRDAGEEEADDEVGGDGRAAAGVASTRMPRTGEYESSCAKHDPANSQPRFTESSDHGASGPGSSSPCWRYSAVRLANTGGSAKHEPVEEQVVDAERRTGSAAGTMPVDALGGEDQAVRAEASVARQRAAGEVLERVGDEREDQARQQHRSCRGTSSSARPSVPAARMMPSTSSTRR